MIYKHYTIWKTKNKGEKSIHDPTTLRERQCKYFFCFLGFFFWGGEVIVYFYLYLVYFLCIVFLNRVINTLGFPDGTSGKETACQCRIHKRLRFYFWVKKIPWRKAWQSTLAWRMPWTEEPGELQFIESQRVGHDQSDLACTHT